jgi:hypothetical protein
VDMTDNKQFLYRYRHINGKHREWTKRILTKSVLHFAKATAFNDPFDCKVCFKSSFSENEPKLKFLDLIHKRMPHLTNKECKIIADDRINFLNHDTFLSQITAYLQSEVDKVGVLSFSATDRNILLWSHYAAGHNGVCFKFIATRHTPFFGSALPVSYTQTYPSIDLLSSSDEQIDAFLLTKAKDWCYEREWRIIDPYRGAGENIFPSELLVGIILGARMSKEDKLTVAEWVKESSSPVDTFQANLSKGKFSLEIIPSEI